MAHEAEATAADPYEAVLYSGFPFAQTHPDRLFTVGVLHGLDPAPPGDCRVLEIGCGDGIDRVTMAASLPGLRAVGIDRAAAPLERGRRYAEALGLDVELRAMDLAEAGAPGTFDYVIAHGVYAWVPAPVREALLAVTARALAPDGIAFVSYNAVPGAHVRRAMRDLFRFHARDAGDPGERVRRAREITAFARRWEARTDPYGVALLHELSRMDRLSDHSLVHDDLGEVWEPQSLSDFAAAASAHGLRYFADATLDEMKLDRYPAGVDDGLRELAPDDLVAREQYGDFISGRAAVLEAFRRGLVELRARPPSWATTLPARPATWTLARLMAAEGGAVATLDHDSIRTHDPFLLRVVALLDGTRDFGALLEDVLASVGREIVVEVDGVPVTDVEPLREPFAERLGGALRELLDAHLILEESP